MHKRGVYFMNIFMLHTDPRIAASYHNNRHVVKMILESCQLLSTAHRVLDGEEIKVLSEKSGRLNTTYKLNDNRDAILYKSCHVNHPSNKWVRKSAGNYEYLYNLLKGLIEEYHARFDKAHKSEALLDMLKFLPDNIPFTVLSFPKEDLQAIPDEYKDKDAITAYRNYYVAKKPLIYYKKNGNETIELPIPMELQQHLSLQHTINRV